MRMAGGNEQDNIGEILILHTFPSLLRFVHCDASESSTDFSGSRLPRHLLATAPDICLGLRTGRVNSVCITIGVRDTDYDGVTRLKTSSIRMIWSLKY